MPSVPSPRTPVNVKRYTSPLGAIGGAGGGLGGDGACGGCGGGGGSSAKSVGYAARRSVGANETSSTLESSVSGAPSPWTM